MSKFNSARQDLPIEGLNITVSQPSPELANLPYMVAITGYYIVYLTATKMLIFQLYANIRP